jgi:integrase
MGDPVRYGMRVGVARRLRREHIDLQRAIVHCLNDKGGKDRIVGLPGSLLPSIADLDLFERLEPHDHLWYSLRNNGRRLRRDPIAYTTFCSWYRRGIEAAEVRYLNPHQTRHTYGWWLRGQGFDIEERQLQMGHESIRTTQKYYGHLTVEDLAEKWRRCDAEARYDRARWRLEGGAHPVGGGRRAVVSAENRVTGRFGLKRGVLEPNVH